ncbi:MAG TPA: hypothetical protein VLE49_00265, partial [Anaerolineales bacterium]|nr:hypothetical protein [Anaerolineales bacterium]
MKRDPSRMNKSYLSLNNPVLFAVLAGSISTFIFVFYIWMAQNSQHFEQLQPLLDGTAARPYVYRVLAPFVIRLLSQITSISIETGSLIFMYVSLLAFMASYVYLSSQFLPQAGWRIAALL